MGAVDKLVVLDTLLHQSLEVRSKIDNYMELAENIGAKIFIFSSMPTELTV